MRLQSRCRGLRTKEQVLRSAPCWPQGGPPVMANRVEKEPGALTGQKEEGPPRDGNAALGQGVAVSDPGALHADDAEDHGHEAQEHSHHHQGSC